MTRDSANAVPASSHAVDPFIERVPDPWLGGFSALPDAERRWRARIYAAVYVWSGSAPFSWHIAMDRDPQEVNAMQAFVESLDEAELLEDFDTGGGGRGTR